MTKRLTPLERLRRVPVKGNRAKRRDYWKEHTARQAVAKVDALLKLAAAVTERDYGLLLEKVAHLTAENAWLNRELRRHRANGARRRARKARRS